MAADTGYSVQYGSVLFSDVQTLKFHRQIVRDPSQTDILYHRIRHRFMSYAFLNATHFMGPIGAGAGSAVGLSAGSVGQNQALPGLVMHDRLPYEFRIGGQILLAVEAGEDVHNGPKVIDYNVSNISGQAQRIEMEIELCVVTCESESSGFSVPDFSQLVFGSDAGASNVVLNHRWSVTDQMGANQFWRTVYEGTLTVRTPREIEDLPMFQRHLTVPLMKNNYQRVAQVFAQSPDGLTLRYRIEDQQRHAAPPPPATDWSGTHTEDVDGNGTTTTSNMVIVLRGAPHTPKEQLVLAAVKSINARMFKFVDDEGESVATGVDSLMTKARVIDQMDQNKITMSVTIKRSAKASPGLFRYLNLQLKKMADVLNFEDEDYEYDKSRWPAPMIFDSSTPAGIFANYLQSPCDESKGITQPVFVTLPTVRPERDDVNQEGEDEGTAGGAEESESKVDQPKNFYTFAESEASYRTEDGWLQLPLANAASSGDTVSLVKIHAGVCKVTFTIHFERAGAWPEVIDPSEQFEDLNGITYTPLAYDFTPVHPEISADGSTRVFSVQAKYTYAMSRPPRIGDDLSTGNLRPVKKDEDDATLFIVNDKSWLDAKTFLNLAGDTKEPA